ncbi:MAG: EamA family transporter [SAR116 cluster bacterium]|nr:MAG: EamA family transporter [SAR116 cluster bacterium]|tara:strand:- start:1094 stop:1969 length:876 start_codon:yes stop_codon:yes gene_type:complete
MTIRHILIALLVPLTWGFGFALAKAGLDHFSPLLLMGMRFLIAAAVLVWFVPIPRGYLKQICSISFIAATLQYGLTFSGLARMDATPAVLLVQAEVIFGVIIAALLLGEKPSLKQIVGITISCLGILTIVGAPSLDGQIFGVMLILGGTLAFALGQVLIRRLKGALTGFQLTAWMGVIAGPQMILAAMLFEGDLILQISTAPLAAWGTVLYLGLIMTIIGYSAWYFILARYPVPMVMPVLLLLPVATILGAVSFLGERPDMIVLFGGAIVISGVGAVIIDPSAYAKRQRRD